MFVGREEELKTLREALKKRSAAVLVYGKRKVGKTTIINKVLEESSDKNVYYECIKSTIKDNVSGLTDVLFQKGIIPVRFEFSSFQDVFAYLNSLKDTFNVVIDEYPYLKQFEASETVDSIFQSIIDQRLTNVRLFISGSHVGMMKHLLRESNALYGRFSIVLKLNELNYLEASEFYKEKNVYDKVALYSVFGGSPFVNGFLEQTKTLKENVTKIILNTSSAVFSYAERLLLSDFSGVINTERIFAAIGNGKKKYGEIEQKLNLPNNGLLSKQLKTLIDMELIRKTAPLNKIDDNKKASYEINDNLLRFYYAYVYKNKSALVTLGASAFYDEYIAPSITTFISHRFEDIVKSYFSLAVKKGLYDGVRNIGSYYYDDPSTKTNGEFDVAIERRNGYDIFEVKYLSAPLSLKEMEQELSQVKAIKGIKINAAGFVSISGFKETPLNFPCLTGDDIYNI